MNTICLAKKNS